MDIITCKNCGYELFPTDTVCDKCGTPVDAGSDVIDEVPANVKKKAVIPKKVKADQPNPVQNIRPATLQTEPVSQSQNNTKQGADGFVFRQNPTGRQSVKPGVPNNNIHHQDRQMIQDKSKAPTDVLAIVCLIVGIISLLFISSIGILAGIVGVVIGILGFVKSKSPKWMLITGLVCSGLVCIVFSAKISSSISKSGGLLFKTEMPELTGADATVAKQQLESMNKEFIVFEEREFSDDFASGQITRTNPTGGEKVKKGTAITLYVSKGRAISIPDLGNRSTDDAADMLKSLNLRCSITEQYSDDIQEGKIISFSPEADTIVEEGTEVSLVKSLGSEYRTLPDFYGININECKKKLDELGITADYSYEFDDENEKGMVISCDREPSSKVSIHDKVNFVVSKGTGIIVPNVIGMDTDKAVAVLEQTGMTANVVEEYSNDKIGAVIRASSSADEIVDEDSNITIYVSKGSVEDEFKSQCEGVSYDELLRYPSKYETVKIKVKVKIDDVDPTSFLGVKLWDSILATYNGQDISIDDDRDVKEPVLKAGDTVTIYGYGGGTSMMSVKQRDYQGSLVLGFSYDKTVDKYEIPCVKVKYVEY